MLAKTKRIAKVVARALCDDTDLNEQNAFLERYLIALNEEARKGVLNEYSGKYKTDPTIKEINTLYVNSRKANEPLDKEGFFGWMTKRSIAIRRRREN